MKRSVTTLASLVVAASVLVAGCGQAASTPTQAPAPTAKASEPSKPAAAQPTAAPSTKIDYPAKGKYITLIVPWPAGGGTDVPARLLAAGLEKELGTSFQIVNKPGASSLIGMTELVRAKPDGYTLAYSTMVPVLTSYLDPEQKASFSRKDLQPVSLHSIETGAVYVKADSPYKDMKQLIEAAKASPEKVKVGTPGIMSLGHLEVLQTEQVTGAKFAMVQFDGSAKMNPALLGGHIDAAFSNVGDCVAQVRDGQIRVLAVFGDRVPLLPDVKSADEQGYKILNNTTFGMVAPAGTPKEIVATVDAAIKKVSESEEHKKKMADVLRQLKYQDTAQFEKWWATMETQVKELIALAKR
ncbi:MAG: tripartite tricarboxylate transporter substrate binding protein [Chloroflexota bacterium]